MIVALHRLGSGLGWQDLRTYIASGNLVFRAGGEAAGLAHDLRRAIAAQIGGDVPVIVLPAAALRAALRACPFDPEAGKRVHGFFL